MLNPIQATFLNSALAALPRAKPARTQSGSDSSECWLMKKKKAESTTIIRRIPHRHRWSRRYPFA
jgi:hypothetical protein